MTTMRRDRLRRLCEQGKLQLVASYSYDEMMGPDRLRGDPIPVTLMPEDRGTCREGVCYLHPGDFRSSVGRAWRDDSGLVTLYVHSNSNYTFRIIP